MGLIARIKLLARLSHAESEGPGREPGDLVEPGSVPGPPVAAFGAAGVDQLRELHAAGLIDAETFALIEGSMASAPVPDSGFDAAELELLQRGEPAPATVLAAAGPAAEGTAGRLRMRLEIHPADGPSYEADCTVASFHPAARLEAGDYLQVRVDPADPKRVAVVLPGSA